MYLFQVCDLLSPHKSGGFLKCIIITLFFPTHNSTRKRIVNWFNLYALAGWINFLRNLEDNRCWLPINVIKRRLWTSRDISDNFRSLHNKCVIMKVCSGCSIFFINKMNFKVSKITWKNSKRLVFFQIVKLHKQT